MKKITQAALESLIILGSVIISSQLHLKINLIPKIIFSYQKGYYQFEEIYTLSTIYVSIGILVLLVSKMFNFGNIFKSPKYFAREIFLVSLSSSLSSLVVFTFTKVFFDPNFIAMQILVLLVIYFFIFFVFAIWSDSLRVVHIFSEGLRYTFSISGVLIIAVCLSPVPMAIYFKKDKDFANTVNRIRNISDGLQLKWKLVDLNEGVTFHQPILVRQTPRDSKTHFVLERSGRLFAVNDGGEKSVMLDFSSRVGIVKVENGAVGFTFHPEYGDPSSPNKGYAYFHYTDVHDNRQVNRVSRFDISLKTLSDRLKSELVLIEQQRDNSGFHNGGSIEFGPDGFLYIGVGDANDGRNHQTLNRGLFSGIFRIDVDSKGEDESHQIANQPKSGNTSNYMIPNDNPFVGEKGALEEFWALGLRNPFRFSFDTETGELWAGDVGSEQVEEVDIITRGGNYQFPQYEGTRRTEAAVAAKQIGIDRQPYFVYRHKANERAVIGGVVYRGDKHPDLKGMYIFADNAAGQIYAIHSDQPGQKSKRALAKTGQFGYVGIASVVEDLSGDILATTLGSKVNAGGQILKLEKNENSLFANVIEMAAEIIGHGGAKLHVHGKVFTEMQVKESYIENCSRCHGANGRGSPELESSLARIIPDFTDSNWQLSVSNKEIYDAILKGGAAVGKNEAMPPWEGVLDNKQIESMIKHIRAFDRTEK